MADVYNMKKGVSDLTDLKDVTATAAQINTLAGTVAGNLAGATITVGADAGTTVAVTIQLEDLNGDELTTSASLFAYLSDNADGSTIVGTAPSGGVAIGTDGLLIPVVADKAWHMVSESDGDIDIVVTEESADVWYLVLVMPDGSLVISSAITFT